VYTASIAAGSVVMGDSVIVLFIAKNYNILANNSKDLNHFQKFISTSLDPRG